ncbi:MAG: hypothetical protein JSW67_10095 [Candidatus Latescibacterota bacterium]|nr:MAG: hypothetical protein JSW67_10095 [Candidatus Latescibacterota bacterium]
MKSPRSHGGLLSTLGLAVAATVAMTLGSGLAFADPDDFNELGKRRSPVLLLPAEKAPLQSTVVLREPGIRIGPVPGTSRWGRFDQLIAPITRACRRPLQRARLIWFELREP